MKTYKLLATLVVAGLINVMAYGESKDPVSDNVVEEAVILIPPGGYQMVGVNYDPPFSRQPVQTVETLIGDQLPVGSIAYIDDYVNGKKIVQYKSEGGWIPASEEAELTPLERGMAFLLYAPPGGYVRCHKVRISGRIPDEKETELTVNWLQMLSYPYPAPVKWVDTRLAKQCPPGSCIYLFDVFKQEYQTVKKTSHGWSSDVEIKPGQGFYFGNGQSMSQKWIVERPY